MAATEPDTTSIFEPPENITTQHIRRLSMTCFARLESLMAEGKDPDWTEYIRRGSPTTSRGYWAWDRLTYIQRHIKNAPQAPDLTKQTIHLLYNGDDFRVAVKGASRMVDKVCHGENVGAEAKTLDGETRRYLIPACVAIIKAVFELAGGPEEGLASFTKVTLEVILRALDWIYKLKEVAGDGEGWKGRLEGALEPLAGSVLAAMRDIRDIEAGNEEEEEESRDRDESVGEERGRGETRNGEDGLEEVESKGEESDVESNGEKSNRQESNDRDKGVEDEEGNNEDETMEDAESVEKEECNDEDDIMEEAEPEEESNDEVDIMEEAEPMKEEDLDSGYEPGLESDSDYSATTAQVARSKGQRTRRQTASLSSQDKTGDSAIEETETRASRKRRAAEYDTPLPPKRPCRRYTSPRTHTESEELTGPNTRLRKGQPTLVKESRKEEPRRSARVKKLLKPKKDAGRLGIPSWVEAPLYTTVYNGIGEGTRVQMSNRRGFLVRDGLGFFASKEERLRQG